MDGSVAPSPEQDLVGPTNRNGASEAVDKGIELAKNQGLPDPTNKTWDLHVSYGEGSGLFGFRMHLQLDSCAQQLIVLGPGDPLGTWAPGTLPAKPGLFQWGVSLS